VTAKRITLVIVGVVVAALAWELRAMFYAMFMGWWTGKAPASTGRRTLRGHGRFSETPWPARPTRIRTRDRSIVARVGVHMPPLRSRTDTQGRLYRSAEALTPVACRRRPRVAPRQSNDGETGAAVHRETHPSPHRKGV